MYGSSVPVQCQWTSLYPLVTTPRPFPVSCKLDDLYFPFQQEPNVVTNMSEKQFCSGSKKNNLRQHSSPAFFYKDRNFNDFQPPEEETLLGICQGKKIDISKSHRTERVLVRGQKVIQFGKKSKKVKKRYLKRDCVQSLL